MYVPQRQTAPSAAAALAVVLLIAGVLVFGLRVGRSLEVPAASIVTVLEPERKPENRQRPKPRIERTGSPAATEAPAPPNLRNQATQIVAPPLTPLVVPPPVVAATQAGTGNSIASGATDFAGPGSGAGGSGNGTGGGGTGGNGRGGSGGGAGSPPRHLTGRLSFNDLPEGLLAPDSEAEVGVRYKVNADGHVSDCRVDQSSGIAALDALTCRLIEQRFRFQSARDDAGRPVDSIIVESHTWVNLPR